MKTVVSVSLGTSKRDKTFEVEILGHDFRLERRGTDGDKAKFQALMEELDGKVDVLGVGGADLYVATAKRRYAFRDVFRLIRNVKRTPVVDGSGLKHTLERATIERLQEDGTIDFRKESVLLVSAVDRFGMAQALDKVCPKVIYGDLIFGLGLPIPLRKYSSVQTLASILLPLITACPIQWFYPTGTKQEVRKPQAAGVFAECSVICGDWHYIRRSMPDDMRGKTVLTQSVREADLKLLKELGTWRVITTTPEMGGESFATNVMEGVIVALLEKRPEEMSESDYLGVLEKLGWSPAVTVLNHSPVDSEPIVSEDDA